MTKKLILCAMLVLVLFSSASVSYGAVSNGGFESPTVSAGYNGTGAITNWIEYSDRSGSATLSDVTSGGLVNGAINGLSPVDGSKTLLIDLVGLTYSLAVLRKQSIFSIRLLQSHLILECITGQLIAIYILVFPNIILYFQND